MAIINPQTGKTWGGKREGGGKKKKWANLGETVQVSIPKAVKEDVLMYIEELNKKASSDDENTGNTELPDSEQ